MNTQPQAAHTVGDKLKPRFDHQPPKQIRTSNRVPAFGRPAHRSNLRRVPARRPARTAGAPVSPPCYSPNAPLAATLSAAYGAADTRITTTRQPRDWGVVAPAVEQKTGVRCGPTDRPGASLTVSGSLIAHSSLLQDSCAPSTLVRTNKIDPDPIS